MPNEDRDASEEIRLGVVASSRYGGCRELFLDISLKELDSATLAQEVMTRAAIYRLRHTDTSNEDQAMLRGLAEGVPLRVSDTQEFAMSQLPGYRLVGSNSSYPC